MCSNLVLSMILKREPSLLPVNETSSFMFLGNNFFTVFLTDLIICFPFSPWYDIWYQEIFFLITFFNYRLVMELCAFVWDITICYWISLFNFYLFKYLIPKSVLFPIIWYWYLHEIGIIDMILAWKSPNVDNHLTYSLFDILLL